MALGPCALSGGLGPKGQPFPNEDRRARAGLAQSTIAFAVGEPWFGRLSMTVLPELLREHIQTGSFAYCAPILTAISAAPRMDIQ